MKGLILAAGPGRRLEPVTQGVPTCLVQFGDRTILDCQIEALSAAGISEIGIVTGYNRPYILNHLRRTYFGWRKAFHIINNPWFRSTNSMYSLWLSCDWVNGESFVCLNANVLFHPRILLPALKAVSRTSMIVDSEWRDEKMKVIIRDAKVVQMSKGIGRHEYNGSYIGITTFAREVTGLLFDEIGAMVTNGELYESFTAAVQRLVGRGLRVGFTSTQGLPWAEIDDPSDLELARTHVHPRLPTGTWGWIPRTAHTPKVA